MTRRFAAFAPTFLKKPAIKSTIKACESVGKVLAVVGVVVSAANYLISLPRLKQQAELQAWQVIEQAHAQGGAGGRPQAMQLLAADNVALDWVDVSGAHLDGLVLRDASLRNANFSNAHLHKAAFTGSELEGSSFQGARVHAATFDGASLRGAKLNGISDELSDMAIPPHYRMQDEESLEAVWVGRTPASVPSPPVSFVNAIISDTSFDGPKTALKDANFEQTKPLSDESDAPGLAGASFTNADLARARFAGRHLWNVGFSRASLMGADFSGAELHSADFRLADLEFAKFDGADLEWADFRGACLDGATFKGAKLNYVNFRNAHFSGGIYDPQTQRVVTLFANFSRAKYANESEVGLATSMSQADGLEDAAIDPALRKRIQTARSRPPVKLETFTGGGILTNRPGAIANQGRVPQDRLSYAYFADYPKLNPDIPNAGCGPRQ